MKVEKKNPISFVAMNSCGILVYKLFWSFEDLTILSIGLHALKNLFSRYDFWFGFLVS
jgi:hypothetical protein